MEKEIELEQEAIVVYSGGGAVNSVNGYTGDVVLTTSDLENTSDYQTGTEVESAISTAIAGKQDTLTAGNNITISNNTISATDTTYSAGTGLTLDGTQFSVDTETIATQQDVSNEATARENADTNLQGQIDAISASSDVTDIVGTYADLQAYDTTHLKDNDIIKVLQDESQNDETTYYRWSTSTQTFTLIGEEGPYYTKSQTDTLLQAKQDNLTAGANITIASDNTISATDTTYTAGTNVSISSGNVISATDTTYSDFAGTDGTAAGTAGLVPAPATTDAGKFLGASGLWEAVQAGGVTELTSADYNYPTDNPTTVALWLLNEGVYTPSTNSVSIKENGSIGAGVGKAQALYIISDEDLNGWKYVTVINPKQNSTGENIVTSYKLLPSTGSVNATITSLYSNNMVQTTGTSTTDVMSQDATTSMVFADPSTKQKVQIGNSASAGGNNSVAVGYGASSGGTAATAIGRSANSEGSQSTAVGFESVARGTNSIALGHGATGAVGKDGTVSVGASAGANSGNASYSTQIGYFARATSNGGIALGSYSSASAVGEMNIGSTSTNYGYNSSNYRLLTGLYDGQSAHDAATYGQVISYSAINGAGAPTTATEGKYVGQLYYDTTNEAMYFLKTIDTTTTPATYTWEALGGGSSVNVVQTTGTSTTDVMSQNAVTSMVFADPATERQIRVGNNANSTGLNSVAIGRSSAANHAYSVALGAGSTTSGNGMVSIGGDLGTSGYNNSAYRLLSGVYDGQSAHDAATKGQLDSIAIQNAGAPTTATVGTVGQLLEDTTNGKLYICTDATNPYVWEEVGSGGGSGPTVVQTTGTSTTDVMSQNAVTSMVYADPGSNTRVRIGAGADNIGQVDGVSIGKNANNGIGIGKSYVIGIGSSAMARAGAAVAIGIASSANGVGSIALGARAQATSQGEMNIGTSLTSYGYNSSNYRLLTGLYDPQSAHDAATKGYVDPTTDSSAPTTATVGRLGQIQIDTATATAYMCVAVDTVTPAYTWKQITA